MTSAFVTRQKNRQRRCQLMNSSTDGRGVGVNFYLAERSSAQPPFLPFPFPFLLPTFCHHLSPPVSSFPSLPTSHSPVLSSPLEVGPLNPARGSGQRCKLPQPQWKSNLMHKCLKIRHLLATISMIFSDYFQKNSKPYDQGTPTS